MWLAFGDGSWLDAERGLGREVGDRGPVGAVGLAERAAGRRAGAGDLGESGDDDAPGQAGEEQSGGQAVGGELVGAAVRDAFDDLVGAEPAQVVADRSKDRCRW